MQYVQEMRISSRKETPFVKFLRSNPLLRIRAQGYGQSAIDYIADGFLPIRLENESYETWIVRQVKEALEVGLMHDEMGSTPNPYHPHLAQRVHSVTMEESDRADLVETFGRHPDVMACWDAVTRDRVPLEPAA